MNPKNILVTGATHGIGLATASALLQLGHQVCIHGRSRERGHAALAALRQRFPAAQVHFLAADFAALADVRRLAAQCNALWPTLDVLINNAGCAYFSRQLSRDGYEATFAVNHLAPFLLTRLLLPKLLACGSARIVTVSSAAHRHQHLDFDDLMSAHDYHGLRTYGRSKLANILFTRALAKRLADTPVTANALHPGVVNTGLGQNNRFARIIGRLLMPVIGISAQKGARTSVYLATSPQVAQTRGAYFSRCREAPLRTDPQALSESASERLWQLSEQLVAR